ncbi:MAG: M55 family metallopeptidase [Candidatus Poribacteria bacterium]
MKVYISADIEGITGIVHDDQTFGTSSEYALGKKFMTNDVNSAIEGALKAGAKEIYVKDAHGNGRNILLDELKKEAFLIAGWDIMSSMVQGIDETFDALILIGYHSKVGTENGILAHTMTGCIKQLSINNIPIGEPELSALTAGYYEVPTVFIAGDQTAVKELSSFIPDISYVITKYGMGVNTGKLIHPELTNKAISEGIFKALSELNKIKPFKMNPPLTMSLKLSNARMADLISLVPDIQRINIDEVRYIADNIPNMLKMFRVMLGLAWSLR